VITTLGDGAGRHWMFFFGGGGGGIEGAPQNGFFGTTPYFLAIADIKKQNV